MSLSLFFVIHLIINSKQAVCQNYAWYSCSGDGILNGQLYSCGRKYCKFFSAGLLLAGSFVKIAIQLFIYTVLSLYMFDKLSVTSLFWLLVCLALDKMCPYKAAALKLSLAERKRYIQYCLQGC